MLSFYYLSFTDIYFQYPANKVALYSTIATSTANLNSGCHTADMVSNVIKDSMAGLLSRKKKYLKELLPVCV